MLMISACVLGIMLYGSVQTAEAGSGQSKTVDNDYIMITAQFNNSTSIVYIIHVPSRRLVAYNANRTNNTFRVIDFRQLDAMF